MERRSKIACWIEAMRLRTLPVSVAGVVMAVGVARGMGCFEALPSALCLIFAVLCQISSNFANEYFDFRSGADRPGREGPRRGVTEGDITPRAMLLATVLTLALACATGLSLVYWGGWWLVAVGAVIALGVIAYSAGPYPLSRHCLGEAAVLVFFGLVPVNFTFYLQAGYWSWQAFAASVGIGLLGANVIIINNYRDRHDDAACGKHTLAVRFGLRAMRGLYTSNGVVASASLAPLWSGALELPDGWCVLGLIPAVGTFLLASRLSHLTGRQLNPMLGRTSLLMLAYALIFTLAAFAI